MAFRREAVIRSAEKYVARGKLEAAIREYRKVLKHNPNDASILNRVGDLYARVGRFGEAVKLFTPIAEQYTEDGFFVKAIAIYKKIIKLDPSSLPVYERLAELYAKQGLVTEARTQYQVLADYYQKHDNAASAITIYQRMTELEPENPAFHLKLAELYASRRLIDKALQEYRRLADVFIVGGSLEEAAQVYLRALDVSADDLELVEQAVTTLHDNGDVAAAAQVLARAVELNPAAEAIASRVGIGGQPAVDDLATAATEPEAEGPGEADGELDSAAADHAVFEAAMAAEPDEPAGIDEAEVAVFTIDLDDDEIPESLVTPPDDLLEAEPPATDEGTDEAFELVIDDLDADDGEVDGEAPAAPAAALDEEPLEELEIEWPDDMAELDLGSVDETFVVEVEPADTKEIEPAATPVEPAVAADELGAPPTPTAVRREEDLLAEAQVFAKYGLREKAEDRLRQLLELRTDHRDGMLLLTRIHLQAGEHAAVIERANEVAQLARAAGDVEPWQLLREELIAAGYTLEGDRVTGEPGADAGEEDRIAQLLDELDDTKSLTREPAAAEPSPTSQVDEVLASLAPPADTQASVVAPAAAPAATAEEAEPPLITLADELDLDDLEAELTAQVAGGQTTPPPSPPGESPSEHDESMSWLDEVTAQARARPATEEAIFADEDDDFFDLGAELERELSQEDRDGGDAIRQSQEQNLQDIVEGFKRGVAEHLSPEDYDTHFNLGIAYREMGLLDEAIGEFQLASKDARHLVEASSMLGMCFMEKGLPELAVKWYRKGLATPEIREEQTIGMLYDMGVAYDQLGDVEAARRTFVEVYGINSHYRDVASRLEELPQVTGGS